MTWNIHYTIPFMSRDKNAYTVNVYEWDYTGDVVTLTGASEPFVTQEDDDDDIFTPVRTQTGYLRVIDTTGGQLLEEMMPANNTEKPVRLMLGDTVCWQGFLAAQGYSQPWDNHKNKIEFQVISAIYAMKSIDIPSAYRDEELPLSQFLTDAYAQLYKGDTTFIPSIRYITSDMRELARFEKYYINCNSFISTEENVDEGKTDEVFVGDPFYDSLEAICALFGFTLREYCGVPYFTRYDENTSILRYASSDGTYHGGLKTISLLDAFSSRDANNTASYIQGAKVAKVILTLPSDGVSFGQPAVDTSDDEPIITSLYDESALYIQEHTPRNSEKFTYNFWKYDWSGSGESIGESNAADTISHSLIHGYVSNPHAMSSSSDERFLYTGAFPVRFYLRSSKKDVISLSDGLYFNAQYLMGATIPSLTKAGKHAMVTLTNGSTLTMRNGYIRIYFDLYDVYWVGGTVNNSYSGFFSSTDYQMLMGYTPHQFLTVAVKVGSKYWDKSTSAWVDDETTFEIDIENNSIVTNYDWSMFLDVSTGYFIPVVGMTGTVTLIIYDRCINKDSNGLYHACYTHVMTNLKVRYMERSSIVSSDNSENVYREDVQTGFSDTKSVNLTIGTSNNNDPMSIFIRDKTNSFYVAQCIYLSIAGITAERPERHLVRRMATYYKEIRRTLLATIHSGLDLMLARYKYNNRLYFGIDAQHNWRDDTQEVKFIEAQAVAGDDETAAISLEATISIPSELIDSTSVTMTMTGQRKYLSENFDESLFYVFDWSLPLSNTSLEVGTDYDLRITCADLFSGEIVIYSCSCTAKTLIDEDNSIYQYTFKKTTT